MSYTQCANHNTFIPIYVNADRYFIKYCCFMQQHKHSVKPIKFGLSTKCPYSDLPLCTIRHNDKTLIVVETSMEVIRLISSSEYIFIQTQIRDPDMSEIYSKYKRIRSKYKKYYKKHNDLYSRLRPYLDDVSMHASSLDRSNVSDYTNHDSDCGTYIVL
jgi:hypothetical protein